MHMWYYGQNFYAMKNQQKPRSYCYIPPFAISEAQQKAVAKVEEKLKFLNYLAEKKLSDLFYSNKDGEITAKIIDDYGDLQLTKEEYEDLKNRGFFAEA